MNGGLGTNPIRPEKPIIPGRELINTSIDAFLSEDVARVLEGTRNPINLLTKNPQIALLSLRKYPKIWSELDYHIQVTTIRDGEIMHQPSLPELVKEAKSLSCRVDPIIPGLNKDENIVKHLEHLKKMGVKHVTSKPLQVYEWHIYPHSVMKHFSDKEYLSNRKTTLMINEAEETRIFKMLRNATDSARVALGEAFTDSQHCGYFEGKKMKRDYLYSAIFKRKSIREYDLTPLDQNLLDEVSENLRSLKPMTTGIKTEFKIISPDQVRRALKKAPHYVAAFSEAKDVYGANVGFMLQQMDLYFSASGLGSCWLGIPQPSREVIDSSNLEFVILMGFGNPRETLHRTSVSEFKRKPLSEITDIDGADELLEPARLAPSAVNWQNWYFTGDKNLIHAYSFKPGLLRRLGGKYFPINVGIAVCHLDVAAEHFGRKATIMFEEKKERNPPRNSEYIASLEIEQPPTKESA